MTQEKPKLSSTMSDVALRAGVSKVAVSVVLHNTRTNTRVSPTTRQRIIEAAQDLKYPYGVSRALRRRSMNIIGLYLGHATMVARNAFYGEIISGLQEGCNLHRKDLLLHGTFRGQSVEDIYSELINGKIDGLVMFAKQDDPLVLRLASSSVPVITIADAVPNLPSVTVDDRAGAVMIAEHLSAKGHNRILYRPGLEEQESVRRRQDAFIQAAEALRMKVVVGPRRVESYEFTDWEKALLAPNNPDRPTAVVCWCDYAAQTSVEECEELGWKVPAELAIVGFDGIPQTFKLATRLTTVRAPWLDAARTAVDLIMDSLEGRPIPNEIVLPVEFLDGDTA